MNIVHKLFTLALLSSVLTIMPGLAIAANTHASVDAAVLSATRIGLLAIEADERDQGIDIRIKLSALHPFAAVTYFSSVDQPRIVIDLADTENVSGSQHRKLALHGLRAYRIVQSEGRSRIVFSLTQTTGYTVRTEGDTIVLSLKFAATPITSPPARVLIFPSLKNIIFRRGPQGQARIIIDLPGPAAMPNVRRQGKQLIADFIDTALPETLQRQLDVIDFATPVRTVRRTQEGNDVRMLIDADGAWDYNAYQKDAQLISEVQASAENGKCAQQDYRGDKLSLHFQNVEVRTILQLIADFTDLNIIASDSVTGSLTLRLKDVPWNQALDIVLQARGLNIRRDGRVIWIAPRDELLAKEKLELEQRAQIAEL